MVRKLADEGMTVLLVEHRVEDVMRIRPSRVMFMRDGEIRYLGSVSGLSNEVDYHEVKLPARDIVERARADAAPRRLEILPGVPARARDQVPLVKFENVAFGYEAETEVLRAIDLEIHSGDVIAVLGANGAGKTTLVKHAIGLLKPRSGRVLVEAGIPEMPVLPRSRPPWAMCSRARATCSLPRRCARSSPSDRPT